jgi:hypothetical protein
MGILKKYHFTAPLVGTGDHQAPAAGLAAVSDKGIFPAEGAMNHKGPSASGADRILSGYFPQAGGTPQRKGASVAAFWAESGVRFN